jgi:general secretion pathway protein G
MNTRKHAHNAGFTLVEILIVVVILGILSAIVIPQFTSASDTAKANALTTQLQTIRSQLELYRVQHGDSYPDKLSTNWDQLTQKTNASGSTTGDDLNFGPYLQKAPTNAFSSGTTVVDVTGLDNDSTGAAGSWAYDSDTGAIRAILTQAHSDKVGLVAADGDITIGTYTQETTTTPVTPN